MGIRSSFRGAFLCFYLSLLLLSVTFSYGDEESTVEVVGIGECADCAASNIKTSQALSGLRITIDCKPENGNFRTRGVGELDEEGMFKVNLPDNLVKEGKLKEECYAQLHSASAAPCPTHSGLESSRIIFKSKNNGKHIFGLAGKLAISPMTCTSAFLWPHFKYPPQSLLPPLPPLKSFGHHHFLFPPKVYPPKVYHPFPPKVFPPKPLPPPVPVYKPPPKKVSPPPAPIYEPPPAPVKPLPPPVPVKKPCPPKPPVYKPPPAPVYKPKPKPPPVPVYKPKPKPKPKPPPVPVYKPKPKPPPVPIYKPKPPPVPIYKPKPPIFYKPFPPFPKKPCPPLPKLPPFPKIPPKYFHHPKFGKNWPPLPPYSPIHW